MIYPYSLNIAPSIESGDEIVILRPEVPIRLHGPGGQIDILALVDSGADSSIFPQSAAKELGIATIPGRGPGATAFGGQRIDLSFADVVLELVRDDDQLAWTARVYFADFPVGADSTVILGHEGFLDFFTAEFDGEQCTLELTPNGQLPVVKSPR